jgi:hypothetical protein
LFKPFSHKELPNQEQQISKIKNKMKKEDFEAYKKLHETKLPHLIKVTSALFKEYRVLTIVQLFDGDGVDLPKSEMKAGEVLKFITVALYDGQKPPKIVDKSVQSEEQIVVTFKIEHKDTGQEKYSCETDKAYKTGKYCFKDVNVFDQVGTYVLKFSISVAKVKPVSLNQIDSYYLSFHSLSMSLLMSLKSFKWILKRVIIHSGTNSRQIVNKMNK